MGVSKKEMEFTMGLLKSFCHEFINKKEPANVSTDVERWQQLYNDGFKCCCEIVLEKIDKLYQGQYKF